MRTLLAVLVVLGAALIVAGFAWLHPAAGFIALGAALGATGLFVDDGTAA